MNQIITTEKLPIFLWANEIEDGALKQARDIANLPFAFHHVAIMADAHQGYGVPIGGVLATEEMIIPNAIGVDIGCGMTAARTDLIAIDNDSLKIIMGKIRETIPVGFNHHKERQDLSGIKNVPDVEIIQRELNSAHYQLGTLGGGNHFIEIQQGNDGHVWIMLHSGSRNLGLKIANEYHKKAQKFCANPSWNIPRDLAFLPTESKEGQEYWNAMTYALAFAYRNRQLMLCRIIEAFDLHYGFTVLNKVKSVLSPYNIIDIHHNYASLEYHHGKTVIVHRKGACAAFSGNLGIIPGAQGMKSYIVKGLGNPDSFNSSSHGAGRRMSRTLAKTNLSLEEQKEFLDAQGIVHEMRNKSDLDEAPGAYKNIDEVMGNQKDLVRIEVELKTRGVIKA